MDALLVYTLRMGLKFTTFRGKKNKPTTQLKSYPYLAEKQANKTPQIHICLQTKTQKSIYA